MVSLRGYIPDKYEPDKWVAVSKLIGTTPAPAPAQSVGLVIWADRVEMQPGQSCVGHGIAGAIYAKQGPANIADGVPERPRIFPSPLAIYYNARVKGGYAQDDMGSSPSLAFAGLTDYGYCAIEDWPSTKANIPHQPGAEAYRLATDQRVIRYYRIVNDGDAACEDIRQAVSQRNPVVLALQVDMAFENLHGEVWKGPTNVVGGHYVWVVEYTPEYVVICNSWGRSWGAAGFGKVAWSAIGNPRITSDRYAITFAPTPSREVA